MDEDIKYMKIALNEAKKAFNKEELPIGAVLVIDDQIIKGHNTKHKSNRVINHAEIIVIDKANKFKNNWRLLNSTMYVTLEPCPMCASAIVQSRIKRLVIGTKSDQTQSKISRKILKDAGIEVKYNVLKEECEELLKTFFIDKR